MKWKSLLSWHLFPHAGASVYAHLGKLHTCCHNYHCMTLIFDLWPPNCEQFIFWVSVDVCGGIFSPSTSSKPPVQSLSLSLFLWWQPRQHFSGDWRLPQIGSVMAAPWLTRLFPTSAGVSAIVWRASVRKWTLKTHSQPLRGSQPATLSRTVL